MSTSPFDHMAHGVEGKIVVALERISEAFRVLLWEEGKKHGLSPIQIQILIFCLFHSEDKCKVGYLAREFNMTKATISDSVSVLHQKGLMSKSTDPLDSRSSHLGLTAAGKAIAVESSLFAKKIEKPIDRLSEGQKQVLLTTLLNTIHRLHMAGIIQIQRMCFTCQNYTKTGGGHFCTLLNTPLQQFELRVDCPEHEAV